jgi:hypothetical protein
MSRTVYEEPRQIGSIDDCIFYHSMDLPNLGFVRGQWDLRNREAEYLGHVGLKGKTVLEVGTASGHLCFFMEREGAHVVAYDLSEKHSWDIVPYAANDTERIIAERADHLHRLNNSFWFAHAAFHSRTRAVYGSIYDIPEDIGLYDIGTLGSILLHVRDPFLVLQRVSSHVTDTIVITDVRLPWKDELLSLFRKQQLINFLPDASTPGQYATWWHLSPGLIIRFLKILGFVHIALSYHTQLYYGREVDLYTIVASRKQPAPGWALGHGQSAGADFLFSTAQIGRRIGRGILRRMRIRK